MRGVDRGDQRIGYYNSGRRSKKWWKRVFAYVIECSILNAFVSLSFVKSGSECEMRYLNHRIILANGLIVSYSARRRIGRPPSTESCNLLRLNLSLDHFPGHAGSRQRCVVCSKHGEMCDTWCVCTVCLVHWS